MKLDMFNSKLMQVIDQRNGYLVLATSSLLLCLILSFIIFILIGRERTVVMPPVVDTEFWVTNNAVSAEYLYQMTNFYALINFNFTPDNIDKQHAVILHYTKPSYFNELKTQYVEETDRVKKGHISSSFSISDIKVDPKIFKAEVTGDLKISVGEANLPAKHVMYEFTYKYTAGQLQIVMIREVQKVA